MREKFLRHRSLLPLFATQTTPLSWHVLLRFDDINQAFREKVREHNQTRMQRNEYSREEKFLSEEKPALIPLPLTVIEKKFYTELLVAGNNYIYPGRDKHLLLKNDMQSPPLNVP